MQLDREVSVTIRLIPREDGGLRICSDDVPGLILSHSDQDTVMADLGPALAALLTFNPLPPRRRVSAMERTDEEKTKVAMAQLEGLADLWWAHSGYPAMDLPERFVKMVKASYAEGLYNGRCSAIDDPPKEVREKLESAADLEFSFDIRWKADQRAIKRWQAAHPGNDLVWPDHADLVVWLMEQIESLGSVGQQ